MLGKTGHRFANIFHKFMMINPLAVFYYNGLSRKVLFRMFYFFTACQLIGLVRRPYIKRQIFQRAQSQKQVQQEQASNILSKIDIKLSDYSEDYFVILSAYCSPQKQQQMENKQRVLFEINNLINSRLQINQNYFGDIKFLFIGDKQIYDLLKSNSTIIEFYEKEKERSNDTTIFIMTKDEENNEKLINSLGYKPDLNSIMRIISKHKARKFATSLQF